MKQAVDALIFGRGGPASRFVVALAVNTFLSSTAYAQSAPDEPVAASEIVVTAQRRAELLEDVPLSITALSADDLVRANVQSFRDIETIAPGVRIANIGVFTQPAIRGITSTAVGPGIENNTAFYVDGFYQPDNSALGADFANVSGVQVLKGPQGTLYGRNALGGAMLVTTREPDDEELILDADATYGSRRDVRLRAYVGLPVAPGISLGIGAYHRRNDGYIRLVDGAGAVPASDLDLRAVGGALYRNYITPNPGGRNAAPYKNDELRVKLKLEPTSDLTLVFGYNYLYKFNPVALAYNNTSFPYLSGLPLPPVGPARTTARDGYSGNLNPDFRVKQHEGTLRLTWDLGLGTLNSYSNYIHLKPLFDSDYDGTLVNFLRIRSSFDRKTFIESLDFTMQPDPSLTLVVGGLYYDDDASSQTATFSLGNALPITRSRQQSKAYALFGDVTWELADRLFLNAGLRYSHETKEMAATALGAEVPRASFDSVTPKATIRYQLAQGTNVYASFSQGFKSGTFNSIGQSAAALRVPVKPEKVNAWEIGFKTARGGLHFDAAAYYYDYSNLQVSTLRSENAATPGAPPVVGVFLSNAAAAENYGAEASLSGSPVERLNLRVGAAYTHARYKNFRNAAVTIVCTPATPATAVPRYVSNFIAGCPFTGATAPAAGTPITQDLSGQRIARAPDWTLSLSGDYTIPVPQGEIVLAGNVYYSSKFAPTIETLDNAGNPRFYEDGYVTASASITYRLTGDHLWVRGFVDNLGNTRFKFTSTASARGGYDLYTEPRRFGVTVGARY